MTSYDTDVLIVGAGPVGLTLANDLHFRGVRYEIIDPMPETLDRAKGHGLWGRTLEQLDILELAEPMLAAGQFPIPGGCTYLNGKMVNHSVHPNMTMDHKPLPYSVFMPQHDTEGCLETELEKRGGKVQRNTRLVSFEQDADGVTAQVEAAVGGTLGDVRAYTSGQGNESFEEAAVKTETRTIRARWLVGCDGAHSVTRKALGLGMEGETMPNNIVQTECEIVWTHPRDLQFSARSLTAQGLVLGIYTPFSDAWHLNFIGFGERFGPPAEGGPTIEQLQEAFRETTGMPDAVLRNPKWINRLTGTNFRLPEHFIVDRVILAGDAAHTRSAVGGTGMNGGMQDAFNLGWKLALDVNGVAAPTLVQTYEEEQYAEALRLQDEVGGGLRNRRAAAAAAGNRPGLAGAAALGGAPGLGGFARTAPTGPRNVDQVLDDLADHLPELNEAQRAKQAMMDVNHRGFSLTRDDAPASAPESAAPAAAEAPAAAAPTEEALDAERALKLLTDGEELVQWLSGKNPAFEAHFNKKPADVRAGDYLPDAVCRVGGRGTQLRHVLRSRRAGLFLFTGDEPTAEVDKALRAVEQAVLPIDSFVQVLYVFPSEGWADRMGHPHDEPSVLVDGLFEVRRVLQVEGPEVVYVRPDGYVGLRSRNLDVAGVVDYLSLIYKRELLG